MNSGAYIVRQSSNVSHGLRNRIKKGNHSNRLSMLYIVYFLDEDNYA